MDDWCRAADMILVPMLPSTRDVEPTMRTLEIASASKTQAKTFIILNCFYAFGRLDRDLVEYLGGEDIPVMAKIPRAVAGRCGGQVGGGVRAAQSRGPRV